MKKVILNIEITSNCNNRCVICPHGNLPCPISHKDMDFDTLDKLLNRIHEVAKNNIFIKEIIFSGYGEFFLYKNFEKLCKKISKFKYDFSVVNNYKPIISIVTNGSKITYHKLNSIQPFIDILKFSFPTCNQINYSKIMKQDISKYKNLARKIKHNLSICMDAQKNKIIPELRIHISPPVKEAFENFSITMDFLTKMAFSYGLKKIDVCVFTTSSNRIGLVKNTFKNFNINDIKNKYNNIKKHNVRINIIDEFNVFYPSFIDVFKMFLNKFPCVWKWASLSIDKTGNYRFCINDATSKMEIGNIFDRSIKEIIDEQKKSGPCLICSRCNQHPLNIDGSIIYDIYKCLCRIRLSI